jgi:hypothetical protein
MRIKVINPNTTGWAHFYLPTKGVSSLNGTFEGALAEREEQCLYT